MQDLTDTILAEHELPLMITGHGSMTVTEPLKSPRSQSDYKLVNCVRGAGRITLQQGEFLLQEGMSFIYFPHAVCKNFTLIEPWIIKYLTFNGYLLPRFLHTLNIVDSCIFQLDGTQQMLIDEIIIFQQSLHKDRDYNGSALLYMLLIKLKISRDQYHPNGQKENKLKLSDILSFIKQNYHLDISLSLLAEQMSITEQHLDRIFKKEYQMTPIDYLTRYRLHKAKELLINNPLMTGNEISKAVGFNSPSYFGSVFKKYEGCSPIEFRKTHTTK